MSKPVSRSLSASQSAQIRELFAGRGHALATNPKNQYVAFEVRTDGKSIFTMYTSHKFVATVRDGDAEGAVLAADIAALVGDARAPKAAASRAEPTAPTGVGGLVAARRETTRWIAGLDETGTGELLGTTVIGGSLVPVDAIDAVAKVAARVDTKASRTASGWERLGAKLEELRALGVCLVALPVPNPVFDRYSKNALLDFVYVRAVGELLAQAGLADADDLSDVEIVIDDYGARDVLTRAIEAWRGRGAEVRLETKADDNYLAARAGAVLARSHRAREMRGVAASVDDGPVGTGNAGHRETLSWLRRRHASGRGWPPFVKTSFKTVTELEGDPPVTKRKLPALHELYDAPTAAHALAGRWPDAPRLRLGDVVARVIEIDTEGDVIGSDAGEIDPKSATLDLLPVLVGGAVLDESTANLDDVDVLIDRDHGFLSGWRILTGPDVDPDDPVTIALARAHTAGAITLVRTDVEDPVERATRHAAMLVTRDASDVTCLALELHEGL